jgi:hypothetical protein
VASRVISPCLDIVANLLNRCTSDQYVFPPTDLYNEGWLLRIILDWFSRQPPSNHELSFSDGCKWFSEALIPSQFLARFRGDPLSETWTHADGIIGHIKIGRDRKTDATVEANASHLVITEAKMFSRLSAGVKNAPYFNQAARYAACMAELLNRSNRNPAKIRRLGLYVLAPEETIGYGCFEMFLDKKDIRQRVERRVRAYEGAKDQWLQDCFLPTLGHIKIQSVSWESVLGYIGSVDSTFAMSLNDFYRKCMVFNRSINNNVKGKLAGLNVEEIA